MSGQVLRDQAIMQDAEEMVRTCLSQVDKDPATFPEALEKLESHERISRLSGDTVGLPIYAAGVLKLHLATGRTMEAFALLQNIFRRRSQAATAITACSDVLNEKLSEYKDGEDDAALEPLLRVFVDTLRGVLVLEALYLRSGLRLMQLYRRMGDSAGALQLAETLSIDTAGTITYIERLEGVLTQIDVALAYGKIALAEQISNRIREKALNDAVATVGRRGDEALLRRFEAIRRRYYLALYQIALSDRRSALLARVGWEATKTYLVEAERAQQEVCFGAKIPVCHTDEQLNEVARLLSTVVVACLLDGFSSTQWVVSEMWGRGLFPKDASQACPRAYRAIASLVHPFARAILSPEYKYWHDIEAAFKPLQSMAQSVTAHNELPMNSRGEESRTFLLEMDGTTVHFGRIDLFTQETDEEGIMRLWRRVRDAYIEYQVCRAARFYKETTLQQLAALVHCETRDVEQALMTYEGHVEIDRLTGHISLEKPIPRERRLRAWMEDTRTAITNIARVSQLVEMDVLTN
ncbi:hypothetical protein GMRT_10832 [Giardia muris]|uniref:PSMD12/CSN4-like N-terminal domain-containing protein n=1 Tax=Giardia muris TaxID=5742 RepID=A0A4Z1T4S7_GIAMU|nr:hypothetical protein GMRT_10832 [Giardia muris]|eukprot:TNJ27529.1 hypothetical protein GMRT_10832 [Giardia muris]